jgi:plastocyanin
VNRIKRSNKLNEQGLVLPIVLLVVVALLIAGGYIWLKSNNLTNNLPPQVQNYLPHQSISSPTTQSTSQGTNQALPVVEVTITKEGFTPQTIKVKQGQQVKWVNKDNSAHQVAPDPHPSHTSYSELAETDEIKPGESLTFTIEKTGTITYHDHLNPSLKATIVSE